ncbi:DUF4142 domain-containing protein [Flavobacterium sp.]|uniref:DUF4142 domain-containing protein n=1 Tax=Flavobacterium sp. TaxID=239 RepID=UPI0026381E67|nr:DUF4142 domain-containing protein [Flavobacterium sp.]
MKNIGIIGGVVLGTALLFGTMNACKDKPKAEDPQEVAEEKNEAISEEAAAIVNDSQYLVDAAATDLTEIKIGELAQQKGVSAEVKKFGKMLAEEHKLSIAEVQDLAASKNINLPSVISEEGMNAFNELNEKSGAYFDKKFAEMMVNGHKKAINQARKATEDAKDDEVRNWATGKIVTLSGHLAEAEELKEKVDDSNN